MDSLTIALTKGLRAIVSPEDCEYLRQWRWMAGSNGAIRATKDESGKCVQIFMHRAIAERMGLDLSCEIDHRNGDNLDNRRGNLRSATRAQNAQNRKTSTLNTTGYKGVSWDPKLKKFRAAITVNKKRIHLGVADTAESAYTLYVEAARKHHGEFARIEGYVPPTLPAKRSFKIGDRVVWLHSDPQETLEIIDVDILGVTVIGSAYYKQPIRLLFKDISDPV